MNNEKPQSLEYRKPKRPARKTALLVISILIAVGVGLLSGLASAIMVSDEKQWPLGAILIAGMVLLVGAAIAATKLLGINATLAIFLASLCTFLLMIGMCSQFRINI
jgi:hypothetical protein